MSFYWIKTKSFIKRLFSNYVWDLPNTQNKIYLTFDDGPTPEITEWVLEELKKHNVKATFFCIGNNIQKYPNNSVKVYNRWGDLIFSKKGYQNDWNGNGLSEGTYFYVLKLVSREGNASSMTGYITLLRDK